MAAVHHAIISAISASLGLSSSSTSIELLPSHLASHSEVSNDELLIENPEELAVLHAHAVNINNCNLYR
jgi:hypothetical protein